MRPSLLRCAPTWSKHTKAAVAAAHLMGLETSACVRAVALPPRDVFAAFRYIKIGVDIYASERARVANGLIKCVWNCAPDLDARKITLLARGCIISVANLLVHNYIVRRLVESRALAFIVGGRVNVQLNS